MLESPPENSDSKAKLASELVEQRDRARSDPFFLAKILGYDFQPDVHAEMFSALLRKDRKKAFFTLSEIKKRLILWPRGHFKTSVVVLEIIQTILNYPDVRILIMQANIGLTKGWLREIKSHFTGDNPKSRLPELFPEFCAEKMGTAIHFTVPARKRRHLKEATVTVASPRSVSTGQHYDIFFADDLVHTGNFRSIEQLDKLENEFSHFVPLIDPGGYTVVTGTRYHHADIYGRIIVKNQGEWMTSIKPAYDADGVLLFPQRQIEDGRTLGFTRAFLDGVEHDDPETFSAQYMNRIIAIGRHLFPEDLILKSVKPTVGNKEYPAAGACYFAVDLATGTKSTSDHSVVAIGKHGSDGRIWVIECIGGAWSPSTLAEMILKLALAHRPQCVLVEKSPGAEFFIEYLQSLIQQRGMVLQVAPLPVKSTKDAKYSRIAVLEGALKANRLVFGAGISDFERFKDEFVQFPKGRHDDRPDAVALLMGFFTQNANFAPAPITFRQAPFVQLAHENETPVGSSVMGFGFAG